MRQPWTSEDGAVTILDYEDSTQTTQEASFCLSQRSTFHIATSQISPSRPPRSQLPATQNPKSNLRTREVCQDEIRIISPVTNLQSEERALRSSASSLPANEQYYRSRTKPPGNDIDPLVAYSSPSQWASGASPFSKPTFHGSRAANQFFRRSESAHTSQPKYPIDFTESYADGPSTEDFSTKESVRSKITHQHETRLSEYIHKGIKVNPKANVELNDGDFMRIVDVIMKSDTGAVHLRGWIFRRTKELNGILERKYNELCWILHVDEDDTRDDNVRAIQSVPVTQVVKRRKIRLTNQAFPAFSLREDSVRDSEKIILNERVLVCRFKYICSYANAKMREQNRWSEKSLQRLRADECDPLLAKTDEQLRYDWRGPTEKGGACAIVSADEKHFRQQEYQRQDDLRATAGHSVLSDQSSDSDSIASVTTGLGRLDTSSSQSHDELVEIPNPTQKARKVFIDLTDSALDSSPGDRSDIPSRQTLDGMNTFARSSENGSAEVIDLDAYIKTSTRLDTVQKEYSGQVTRNFVPRHSASSKRKRPEGRPADQSKRVRTKLENESPRHCRDSSRDIASHQVSFERVRSELTDASNEDILHHSSETISPEPRTQDNGEAAEPPSDSTQPFNTRALSERRYTFGDCFSGAGGVSRGAVQAGLRVDWAFDYNAHACDSYALNNPHTALYPHWAHDFCAITSRAFKVDICHLSPPCQFFSDAHTVMGKDDDMNTASLFAISECIKKARPRVVTLEQTSGLLRRHEIYFNAVVLMFTALGFSIRWRILNCADYGVPQRRMRVFMIASCPGEPLPSFPTPTHSSDPAATGLKPWVTINEAIADIPANWPNHRVENARPRARTPESGDKLARCITTQGGGLIHPSGQRDLTDREFACLQGFPLEHRFGKTNVKKQIGNAVPPVVARVILGEVVEGLRRADGLSGEFV
ncbi:hypothetical protein G7Y79_00005g016670 [Physcia stellaris]|nr:hypothetical protein G7Y79_00005g016670 [Physcia stellaris]